jgi:hypothetical protein
MWSNAVGCCEFHFFGFVIMNFSVCFLEKVKIDMLYSFLYFHHVKHFFFTEHAVSLWNRVVLARRFLSQRWCLSMTNVLLHPYLPDVRSSSFCFIASYTKIQRVLLHWRVGTLQWSLPCRCYTPAVTHHGIMPRYPTIYLFSKIIYSNSILTCVGNNSEIRPYLRANVLLLRRFFLTLDGFSIIVSCQNSQFQLL